MNINHHIDELEGTIKRSRVAVVLLAIILVLSLVAVGVTIATYNHTTTLANRATAQVCAVATEERALLANFGKGLRSKPLPQCVN